MTIMLEIKCFEHYFYLCVNNKYMIYLYVITFLSGAVNSILGAGGGTVAIIALMKIIKNKQNVFGTLCAFVLPITVISVAMMNEKLPLSTVVPICIGGIVGGFIGNRLIKKIKSDYLTAAFALLVIFVGEKSSF